MKTWHWLAIAGVVGYVFRNQLKAIVFPGSSGSYIPEVAYGVTAPTVVLRDANGWCPSGYVNRSNDSKDCVPLLSGLGATWDQEFRLTEAVRPGISGGW